MMVAISVPCGAGKRSDRSAPGGVVQADEGEADHRHRDEHADDQAKLLIERRGADDVAGLQILGCRAGIRRGDTDDRANRQGGAWAAACWLGSLAQPARRR